jgi:hypothetical protein
MKVTGIIILEFLEKSENENSFLNESYKFSP